MNGRTASRNLRCSDILSSRNRQAAYPSRNDVAQLYLGGFNRFRYLQHHRWILRCTESWSQRTFPIEAGEPLPDWSPDQVRVRTV